MDLLARPATGAPQHRRSVLMLATVVAALTMTMAALTPASSLGAEPPSVSSVSPAGGPLVGGTSVVIKGARLTGATEVKFGSANAISFTVVTAGRINAISPAGTGTADVTVTTPNGTSAASPADHFTYGPNVTGVSPNRGPASGGTSVTITGSDLSAATAVKFGTASATSFEVSSSTSITAVAPEGTGTVDVTVTDPEATSPVSPADQFSYVLPPTVTGVSPAGGPEAGGTEVTITVTGTELNEITEVDFGLSPASFFINNQGSITAFSPPGEGVVDVTVTAFGGTSLTSFADQFRYVPPPTVTGVSPDIGPGGRRHHCDDHREQPRRSHGGPLRLVRRHRCRRQLRKLNHRRRPERYAGSNGGRHRHDPRRHEHRKRCGPLQISANRATARQETLAQHRGLHRGNPGDRSAAAPSSGPQRSTSARPVPRASSSSQSTRSRPSPRRAPARSM